jgi:hypothetical protein
MNKKNKNEMIQIPPRFFGGGRIASSQDYKNLAYLGRVHND